MSRANLDIPDTIYRYVRPGVGARFELPADLSLNLNAGYRYILNGGGQIKDVFFPHLSVGGFDVSAVHRLPGHLHHRGARDRRVPALLLLDELQASRSRSGGD